jgi:hypothetical protein
MFPAAITTGRLTFRFTRMPPTPLGLVYRVASLWVCSIMTIFWARRYSGRPPGGSPFFVTPAIQELQIRDAAGNVPPPGSTPTLTIRAWTTESGSFAAAKVDTTGTIGHWGEWIFTSPPISGAGSPPSTPPDLTTWGAVNNFSNAGGTLFVIPEPSTIALGVLGVGALVLARRRK